MSAGKLPPGFKFHSLEVIAARSRKNQSVLSRAADTYREEKLIQQWNEYNENFQKSKK